MAIAIKLLSISINNTVPSLLPHATIGSRGGELHQFQLIFLGSARFAAAAPLRASFKYWAAPLGSHQSDRSRVLF